MGARHVAFGEETTVGTAATRDHFFEVLNEGVQQEISFESIEVIRSFSVVDVVENSRIVRGDTELLATYNTIGLLFKHLIGSVDTTTGGATSTHTFPAATGIPSTDRIGLGLTGEFRRDGSLVWLYNGMKPTALTFNIGSDAAGKLNLSWLGMSETTSGSPTTASFDTLKPILPSHVTVTAGSAAIAAKSLTLTVANPLDEPSLLGSTALTREPDRNAALKVTGTIEAMFDNWTDFYNDFNGSNDVDFEITATNGTESLAFHMNKCRLIQPTPHNSGRDRLMSTIEFESYYDAVGTENLQVILGNNNATP